MTQFRGRVENVEAPNRATVRRKYPWARLVRKLRIRTNVQRWMIYEFPDDATKRGW